MGKGLMAVMRYSLGLGHDWKVDKMLVDEQKQRIEVYILHSGGALFCPETGERGRYMIIGARGLGATWIG